MSRSNDNDQYRSRNTLVRRCIEKMDTSLHVKTREFDISRVSEVDSVDDLPIDSIARYLLKDWRGVDELANGIEAALEYTAERGIVLLRQNPGLYWQILVETASIAQSREQQKQGTIEGPQLPSGDYRSSGEKGGKRQDGSEKNSGYHRYRNQK